MNKTHRFLVAALVGLISSLTVGCGDSSGPAARTTGTLEISVSTDSANVPVDPGGYTLIVDEGPGQAISANVTIKFALFTGRHLVRLDGVATNYAINGDNPRWVYVGTDKAPAPLVSFSVSKLVGTSDCGGCWDY